MIAWMINFTCCSALFLAVYYLLFASEQMYRFNRLYLLTAIVFSLVVPLINVDHQLLSSSVTRIATTYMTASKLVTSTNVHNYWVWILFYGIVTFVLIMRFGLNLYQIYCKVGYCERIGKQGQLILLTSQSIYPHSFLHYIFINREQYHKGIDKAIMAHEHAHVRQFHTIDIIVTELVQVFCWFNPLIRFYRKAIQLNHEFLADAEALKHAADQQTYQRLLLAASSPQRSLPMTSQFTYLIIKKRLIMITKTTSLRAATCRQFAVIPVLAISMLLFGQRSYALVRHSHRQYDKGQIRKKVKAIIDSEMNKQLNLQFETQIHKINNGKALLKQINHQ